MTGSHTIRRKHIGRTRSAAGAFSLIELLVVIAIISILLSIVYKGGGALIASGKARDTQGLLQTLEQAINAYKSDASSSRIANADTLFLGAPPDSLHVFQTGGTNMAGCQIQMARSGTLTRSGVAVNDKGFDDQRNQTTGQLVSPSPSSLLHGDVRAMVLAIRLRSPGGAAILDRISERFRRSGAAEGAYYDSGDGSNPIALDYYIDAWGMPIEYFSTSRCGAGTLTPREEASNAFVHTNNNTWLLASYGPDGKEQLSSDYFSTEGDTTIVADFWEEFSATGKGIINHPLNQDNIYSSDVFLQRMGGG